LGMVDQVHDRGSPGTAKGHHVRVRPAVVVVDPNTRHRGRDRRPTRSGPRPRTAMGHRVPRRVGVRVVGRDGGRDTDRDQRTPYDDKQRATMP
jgi:hypothetical protein